MALYPVHVCAQAPANRLELSATADFYRNCDSLDAAIAEVASLAGDFALCVFKKGRSSKWYTLDDVGNVVEVTFH